MCERLSPNERRWRISAPRSGYSASESFSATAPTSAATMCVPVPATATARRIRRLWNSCHNKTANGTISTAKVMFAGIVPVLLAVAVDRDVSKVVRMSTWAAFAVMVASGTLFLFETAPDINGVVERTSAVAFLVWMPLFALSRRRSLSGDDSADSVPR